MYYELYVDVLFLVNFLMDYILLLFVWRILRCHTTHIRIVAGALLGALITCILVILPITNAFFEFVLFHVGVNTCMVQVGLKMKNISNVLKALILLYIGAFFMGGILESLQQYVKIGGLLLLFAILGYYLALWMWKFLAKLQRWNSYHVKVELYMKEKKLEVRGIVDTGNSLYDPYTGQPVSILDKGVIGNLLEGEQVKTHDIPYASIGKQNGVIPVVQIDKMRVYGENVFWVQKPLIGIPEEHISGAGEFEMILSPNLF